MDFKEILWNVLDWVRLAKYSDRRRRAFVNTVINRCFISGSEFVTS